MNLSARKHIYTNRKMVPSSASLKKFPSSRSKTSPLVLQQLDIKE